ncbi:hypothetical protein BROUX41_001655 [Berkeleyomyces rouxiae]|uniref:uncharacterized protein n=1 Tax=Berkeleyomyces rouxiae TaxID=2035830 RepID=UPI003B78B246
MKPSSALGLVGLATHAVAADYTWPNAIDELEEIAFQLFSTNARKFADNVSPCTDLPFGAGRVGAAEWLRTAFHDMATGNSYTKVGGADASIQFELGNSDNSGVGFKATLQWMSPFMTRKTSMADLIGLGLYASVRSCGGPQLEIKHGRIDARSAGLTGVPQVQNTIQTFRTQFDRMGFNAADMIALVACGHTLGGAHAANTPDAVPENTYPNDMAPLDSTPASFDNAVVKEYLNGTTANPLVVGPYTRSAWRSDLTVFKSDNNVTMNSLADSSTFMTTCQNVLNRMYQLVPSRVTLSSAIQPYVIKPYRIALALKTGATQLTLSGQIRVHTGTIPQSTIQSLTITYKSRSGGSGGSYTATIQGFGRGFDDEFAYYPLNIDIDTAVGISSFVIDVNHNDGTKTSFNNNGNGYPVQDYVVMQTPQSCLLSTSGTFTPAAVVHNSQNNANVSAVITYKQPRASTGTNPVPQLLTMTVPLVKGDCYGDYTMYSASTVIPGGLSSEATIDIVSSSNGQTYTDEFRRGRDIGGTCRVFSGGATCHSGGSTSSTTSSAISTSTPFGNISTSETATISSSLSTTVPLSTGATSTITSNFSTTFSTLASGSSSSMDSSSIGSSSSTTSTSTTPSSSSTPATPSPHHRESVGGYALVSCWTEGSGERSLSGSTTSNDDMTLEACMDYCDGYNYWGTEYGRECYCGNSLASSSTSADLSECNMLCSGDSTQYCGSGNRIELYKTTAPIPTPTGALSHAETVGNWNLVGCWTEGDGVRALSSAATASSDMTNSMCAGFCQGYKFFGTEYSRECYCGNGLADSSSEAELGDCSMVCAGDPFQYCGGSSRLELYRAADSEDSSTASSSLSSVVSLSTSTLTTSSTEPTTTDFVLTTEASTTTSSVPATPGPQNYDIIGTEWTLIGCKTEGTNVRALSSKSTSTSDMTLNVCADFCSGFKFFGTEYGSECYCGNSFASSSADAALSDCSMTCSGNSSQYCGAGNRLTAYQSPSTGPSMPATVGEYVLVGCQTEATNGHALSSKATSSSTMTNEVCAEFCTGFKYFGTEYADECYCGNELADGSIEADLDECTMPCAGSSAEYCGAGGRLSLYQLAEDA